MVITWIDLISGFMEVKIKYGPKIFTEKQLTVIRHWSEQPNEAAVAEALGLSEHTVHTHLRRMRAKLGVRRTFEVYKHLLNSGFFER